MSAGSLRERALELESLGVVVVVDDQLQVAHVSEGCETLLGHPSGEVLGRSVEVLVGQQAGQIIRKMVAEDIERSGGWWPAQLDDGRRIKLRAFAAAPGLAGIDLLPVIEGSAISADANSIERVAAWNDWLLACTSSTDLLEVAASVARERLGFDGVWVCRVEPDGHGTVVAADDPGGADLIGQSVRATDLPPSQPRQRGRTVPFFVADLTADGTRMAPGAPELDLESSSLLRPYPEFLDRLLSLGVRATASLPLVVDSRLWGRIISHDPAPRRVSAATQSELRLLAAATSARLGELIEQENAWEQVGLARYSLRLMGSVAASPDLIDGLMLHAEDLVGMCAAHGAIVAIGGRVASTGGAGTASDVETLLETARAVFRLPSGPSVISAATLYGATDVDPAIAAGYLAVRLGHGPEDIVMWVRGEDVRSVTWIEHEVVDDEIADDLFTGVAQRQEDSRGACSPWTAAQLAQADEFREAIGQVQLARFGQVQKLNAELTRSNEEYDAFAHAAAHDLKAPLRNIRQFVDFHLEDTQDRLLPDEQEQLHTITRLTDRMNGLLDGLMAYAQIGQAPWDPAPVPLEDAVAEVVELLGPRVANAAIEATPDTFTTDPAALRQILLNLVSNAAKYSEGPAAINLAVISLRQAASHAPLPPTVTAFPGDTEVLAVSDQGIGIDPSHHERVFGLFHQLEPQSEGFGAGLALCRLICRRRGGEIWLRSAEGAGTTFFVATGTSDAMTPGAAT